MSRDGLSIETFLKIKDWYHQPKDKRKSQTEFRLELAVGYPRFRQAIERIRSEDMTGRQEAQSEAELREIMRSTLTGEALKPSLRKKALELAEIIEPDKKVKLSGDRKENVKQALYEKAIRDKDHNAAFRLAQIEGWITEQKEITVKIDSSIIIPAIIRAERELRESNYRISEVSAELPLLPPNICYDSGQDKTEVGEVGKLAISDLAGSDLSAK